MTVPPIMRTITVRCSVEHAFRVFTEELDAWWPLDLHSRAAYDLKREGVRAERAVLEGRTGGRVYEVMSDGTEAPWGTVLAWEPPHRLLVDWKPDDRPAGQSTEVEVRFTPDGDVTRVDLEHRGWERLGEIAAESREGYEDERGWPLVFDRLYAEAAERQAG